jgi:hypothetical protein
MMNDRRRREQVADDEIGLCKGCEHAQVVVSARGSRFYLCRLSAADPSFPRYPRLPVLNCRGYKPGSGGGME